MSSLQTHKYAFLSMRKIIFIGVSLLLIGGIVGYITLGGLNKPQYTLVQVPGYIMGGIAFKGMASNEDLLKLFEQTRLYHQQKKLPGTLAALYVDIPTSEKGEVDAFVGVLVKDSTIVLPDKYVYKYIPASKAAQATIKSHYLVAPSPEKIRASLLNYAQERGLLLQNFVIEQYIGDSNIIVEAPIK
jgi:effector-binding domain-containing protein